MLLSKIGAYLEKVRTGLGHRVRVNYLRVQSESDAIEAGIVSKGCYMTL